MGDRIYLFNKETTKLELHFTKEEYQRLSDDEKKKLRSGFLFSKTRAAWVSRAMEPNLWRAKRIAQELGFTDGGAVGESISFAEKLDNKAERANERADRLDGYATNAEKRGKQKQSGLDHYRGDIAFFTQPITPNAGGRAFANYRDKLYARYQSGFEEYRKSEYFRERAATARETAAMDQLQDKAYLDRRIREAEKRIADNFKTYDSYIETMRKKENGEEVHSYYARLSPEDMQGLIDEKAEYIAALIDKKAFFINCMDNLGGATFDKTNIKPGYIIESKRGRYKVIKANPTTFDGQSLSTGMILNYRYAEIISIIKADEEKPKAEAEPHPFKEGEIYVSFNGAGTCVIKAYQITHPTAKSVTLLEMILDNEGKPIMGVYKPGAVPVRKKPIVRRFDNEWSLYYDSWRLYKWDESQKKSCVS